MTPEQKKDTLRKLEEISKVLRELPPDYQLSLAYQLYRNYSQEIPIECIKFANEIAMKNREERMRFGLT